MRPPGMAPPPDLPAPGAWIPGVAARAAFVAAGVLLTLVDFGPGAWLVIGALIGLAAASFPQSLLGWGMILFLAAGRLAHHPALTWQFLVLLAGVHLLHILATLTLELPRHGWIQPAVLAAPLRRFLAIQIPTQLLAVVALLLLAPRHDGHRPLTAAGFTVVGVVALAGLALLLFRRPSEDARSPSSVRGQAE